MPNSSFEDYSSCPTNVAQVDRAVPWIDPTNSTPDYFHSCNTGVVNVPDNMAGSQLAQDGQAYVGIGAYVSTWSNFRDYVQAPLLDTMIAGKSYCVSLWISLADTSKYCADKIGALFSNTAVTCNPPGCVLPYSSTALLLSQSCLNNNTTWIELKGMYTSIGGERFITVGNFFDDANTNTNLVNSNMTFNSAYYYLDNISVYEVAPVVAGTNGVICSGDSIQLGNDSVIGVSYLWQPGTTLNDSTVSNPIASPTITTTYTLAQTQCNVTSNATITITVQHDCNPPEQFHIPSIIKSSETLIISGLESNSKLEIFDALGRRIYYSENYQNDFRGLSVAAATYVIQFTKPNGEVVRQKLVVVR